MILFCIQETSYIKPKQILHNGEYQSRQTMKVKKIYILYFIFHANILHIKSSRIPVMESNIKIKYQLVKRKETSYMIIHQEQYI